MGLFKPAWMGKDEAKALRALDKVGDDETLFRIATECPHVSVRLRAVERIKSSDVRLDVARTSRRVESVVREAALQGATEQQLHDVAVIDDALMLFGTRLTAVRMMTDETLLADVAATEHSAFEADASLRAAAFSRVNDRELLLQLMDHYRDIYLGNVKRNPSVFQGSEAQGDKIIRDAVTDAYERIDRPPLEWSLIVQSEKTPGNLMLDLDEMSYPDDRDSIVAALSAPTADKSVRQHAARLLSDDDPLLDERCCPNCGTVGSVRSRSSWSDYWEGTVYWYECSVCDQADPVGIIRKDEDFSITLRELRDM